jgi:hypothetical protein
MAIPRPILPLVLLLLASPAPADDPAPPESFTSEQKSHWAFLPRSRPDLPEVKNPAWVRNGIDRFILAGIEDMGFSHAPEIDRIGLIRRVTFDLTGLPPSPEEVKRFLADTRPDAYERLVDDLLGRPEFGERWAQHWLDLAHYADSNGFELDGERPDAWRYRDWVVNAINSDMPYDLFVMRQLAGDELEPGNTDALIATGFGRCGPWDSVGGNIDQAVKRQAELTEVTSTVGSVFLGLTIACARCHDHKFDPLPTTDYYRLQSYFAGAIHDDVAIAGQEEKDHFAAEEKRVDERIAPIRQQMAALEAPYRAALSKEKEANLTDAERAVRAIAEEKRTPEQKKLAEGTNKALNITWEEVASAVSRNPADHQKREAFKRAIHEIQLTMPRPPAKAMALIEEKKEVPETFVYRRGDPGNRGPLVAPRPPGILLVSQVREHDPAVVPAESNTSNRRLELAQWLVRGDNPLTARVIVNRLWLHHFGRALVTTPNDFGTRGEPPSHPDLLDWLANRLVDGGWKLKEIHRLMVTSATYRQASNYRKADQESDDPQNMLLWRMNRRRLEAESLRDALLAASGALNPQSGGPGVLVPIEKEVEDLIFTEAEVVDLWPETPDPRQHDRRSLYLFRKRNVRYPMFDAFDAPDTQTACPERNVSTHALQPLVLLNSDFATSQAKRLAGRISRESDDASTEARIRRAYQVVLCREPTGREREQAMEFLESQAQWLRANHGDTLARPLDWKGEIDPAEAAAWVDFALAMLNRNEFVYVP